MREVVGKTAKRVGDGTKLEGLERLCGFITGIKEKAFLSACVMLPAFDVGEWELARGLEMRL